MHHHKRSAAMLMAFLATFTITGSLPSDLVDLKDSDNIDKSKIIDAITNGSVSELRKSLESENDINFKIAEYKGVLEAATPLHMACFFHKIEIASALIEAGAISNNFDGNGKYPVEYLNTPERKRMAAHFGKAKTQVYPLSEANLLLVRLLARHCEFLLGSKDVVYLVQTETGNRGELEAYFEQNNSFFTTDLENYKLNAAKFGGPVGQIIQIKITAQSSSTYDYKLKIGEGLQSFEANGMFLKIDGIFFLNQTEVKEF